MVQLDKYMWYVYILQCADKTYYTGIAKDPEKRLVEHNSSNKGAKYTRSRRPVNLKYSKKYKDRSAAAREEWRIKKLGRGEKELIIKKWKNTKAN